MTTTPAIAVTRFAPSPTGHLHIGGARTALFNWAWARKLGGHFVLRIEDTDQARSSDDSTRRIIQDLAWLGMDWDEGPTLETTGATLGGDPRTVGPFFQSKRLDLYRKYLDQLLEADLAYHAFETPDELKERRDQARRDKRPYRYNRAALDIPRTERFKRAAAGERCVIRFLVKNEPVTIHDEVLGDVTIAAGELDDFVIRKADGYPTYHFAVVVDDELMGVSHVVRGQEHLINTPKHAVLQRALGFKTPTYAHLPLIFNAQGGKMSKRDKDKAVRKVCRDADLAAPPAGTIDADTFSAWLKDKNRQLDTGDLLALAAAVGVTLPEIDVEDFRAAGYLPEVVCNYMALLGWSPGDDLEKFDMNFLAENFSAARVGKTNARFDYKKLLAFNNDAICEMNDNVFADRWWKWARQFAPDLLAALGAADAINDRFRLLAEASRPRSKTFRDAAVGARFLTIADDAIEYNEKAVVKTLLKNDAAGLVILRHLRADLANCEDWSPPSLHALIDSFAEFHEMGMGKVAQPLRVALTGSTVSPPIDASLAVLGKASVLDRIDRCLSVIASPASAD